jgi:hypothetical protein
MILMGKSAAELIPFFKQVTENTDDIATASDEAVKAVTDFSDSMRAAGMEAKTAAAEGLGNALLKIKDLWEWSNKGWQHTALTTFLQGIANAVPGLNLAMRVAEMAGSAPGAAPPGLPFDTKALLEKQHALSAGQLLNAPAPEMIKPSTREAGSSSPGCYFTARASKARCSRWRLLSVKAL